MPKKRVTRAQNTRAKPKLNVDEDEMINGMTAAEREAKLANYIKDFDVQVANISAKYEQELKVMENFIDKSFQQIRMKLSVRERNLTVEKYIAEQIQKEDEEKENGFETTRETILATSQSAPMSTLVSCKDTLSKYQSRRVIEPIMEEGGGHTTTQQNHKKGMTNKGQGVTFGAGPTPLTASKLQSRFITPALQRNASAMGWETPLVTPKFDPRLPITPAQKRQCRPGEIAISMAGSPLAMDGAERTSGKSLAINAKSKTMQIQLPEGEEYDDLLENLEIPDSVENWSGNHLKQVMNVFANLMKKGQELDNEQS